MSVAIALHAADVGEPVENDRVVVRNLATVVGALIGVAFGLIGVISILL